MKLREITGVACATGLFVVNCPLRAATCGGSTGVNYYVTPSGNDTNPCSAISPCRQIRQALTLVHPGDIVHVADGVYLGFTADSIAGSAAGPITLLAQGTNAYVQATTDRSDNRDNMLITFCQYLVIDGLNSTNAPRAGMRIDNSPNITVRNGHFGTNLTWGIFTDFSDDTLLENNECYASQQQHGIYISNSSQRPILRANRCHDNAGAGIHMNADASQGGIGLITNAIVENNVIYNNGTLGGAGINMDGVQTSIVRNNLLYNNHASGIAMFQIDGAQGPAGDLVAHNTIDQAADGRWALEISSSAGLNTVRNNILNNRNPGHGGIDYQTDVDAANTDSDYNLFSGTCTVTTNDNDTNFTLTQWQGMGHEPHSFCTAISNVVVNPLVDYHLKTNSPAINAGQTLTNVTTDIEWLTRPAGSSSDISAYEFGAILTPPPVTLQFNGADACISFPTLITKTYRIETADDLKVGFSNVLTDNVPGTSDPFFATDPNAATHTQRFYRVRVGP
jgi:parallel beta-helix repeat protein